MFIIRYFIIVLLISVSAGYNLRSERRYISKITTTLKTTTARSLKWDIKTHPIYDFARNLFLTAAEINHDKENKNIILSPFSIRSILSLLYIASKGETKKELVDGLDFPKNHDDLISELEKHMSSFEGLQNSVLEIGNGIFLNPRASLDRNYSSMVQNKLKTEIIKTDFSDSRKAAKIINAFIKKITKDQISNLVNPSSLNVYTSLYMANALYFTGKWKQNFKATNELLDFEVREDLKIKVPHMVLESDFHFTYIKSLESSGIAIPFKDPRFELLILKPDTNIEKTEFLMESYALGKLSDEIRQNRRNVILKIPKFRIQYGTSLVEILRKFGIKSLFDPTRSDLSGLGITRENIQHFVTNIVHQSVLDIDEKGATVSSATGVEIYPISAASTFILDKPFIFVLNDKVTGPLLIGRIMNPQQVINEQLKITGLILARAGSKGLGGKNMINLLGHPLIYWSITAMAQSSVFDQIWISTDDPEVREYALQLELGLKIKVHDRQKYTATDEATSISAVQEFLSFHPDIQILALIQCTSPLIQPDFLVQASQILSSNSNEIDSIFSVSRQHHFRWSPLVNENEYTKAMNFDPKNRPRRQDWDGELVENGMFYFSRRENLEEGYFQGERSQYLEIPKNYSLQIDSIEDLHMAEILLKSNEK